MNCNQSAMAGFAPTRGSSVRSMTYKQSKNKRDSLLTCAHVADTVLVTIRMNRIG